MQRYTIKQTWRSMKESSEGEFVRYEDVEYEIKTNARLFNIQWNALINERHKNKQARALVDHLQKRVLVLFAISAVSIGCTVVRLILWSLGAL
jgi:hypothetical protein